MDSVVLASPEHYTVSYAINPLTNKGSTVNKEKAMEQFGKLKARYESHGIPVHVMNVDPQEKYPDLVFVSNSVLILQGWPTKVAIVSRYAKKERQGEEELASKFLLKLGYKLRYLPEREGLSYEGQGDSRWSHNGRHLWLCYGTGRTTKSGIDAVKAIILEEAVIANWIPPKIHTLHIVEKKTYHLDLCFLPLPNGRLLSHMTSFSLASRKHIESIFGKEQIINVPLKYLYICNSVWINEKTIFIPKLPECRQWMYSASKMKVEEINVSEFHLAGGSVSCMSLALWSLV